MKKKKLSSVKLRLNKTKVSKMSSLKLKGGTLQSLDPDTLSCGGTRHCGSTLYSWNYQVPCY
ncbi:hypothetical protein ACJD0Z_10435 [Flavobacteriaceae bacterium M23B6Z8]